MRTESSVIANLAEIMQLEQQRVASERAIAQAAREAVDPTTLDPSAAHRHRSLCSRTATLEETR
jgi:hypothetical protein